MLSFLQGSTPHIMDSSDSDDLLAYSMYPSFVDQKDVSMNTQPSTFSTSPPSSVSSLDDSTFSYFTPPPEFLQSQGNLWELTQDNKSVSSQNVPQSMINSSPSTMTSPDFFIQSSSLYPPPDISSTSQKSSPAMSKANPLKRRETSLILSRPLTPNSLTPTRDSTPVASTKRRRVNAKAVKGKVTGACTRCKRLKMKCTFEDQAICARCLVGGHECVVLGRKPRSPGLREILRKQIREKDAKIDELLSQLNPTPSLATPLSIVPSRLSLTDSQRNMYRDVLVWFEKSQSGAKSDVKSRIDVSFLEDSEDEFDSDDEMSLGDENQASSSKALSRSFGSLPGSSAPAGLLVNAVLDIQRQLTPGKDAEMEEDSEDMRIERGIGSKTYFQPGPSANLDLRRLIIERQAAPDILLSGLVTYDDVGKLFDLYFKWINPFIPVLDENIHTPAAVLGRCPFLFTVVCALASRYYNEKPEMYGLAMHLAKATAANAFLDGWKTIEMCQAYILLGAYTPPARRWEEDRYWFYTGIAFRLGIELNLNRIPAEKPTDERNQRELLNRLRTWIICYIMDRCICINLGKPFMVPEDDVIRNVAARFLGYNHQHPNDPYLVSLVELLRIITRFSEMYSPIMESRPNISFEELASAHKVIGDELTAWLTTATERCERDPVRDARHTMQMALMQSVYQYCRLVTFSAGLQQVMKAGTLNDDTIFFAGCLHAASAVLNLMMDGLMPTGLMENSPEQVYALTAFATVVLLKCLRPEFSSKIDRIQEDRIVALVKRLLQTLNDADQREDSEEKDQHTTKRYAGFLQHILVPHIAELEARRKKSSISTFSQIQGPEEEQEGGGGKSSSSSGSSLSALPQVKVTPPSEQPLLPMDFEFVPESNSWDSMFSNQDATPIPPILGFSDSDYLASMMSFTDQSWYNSS